MFAFAYAEIGGQSTTDSRSAPGLGFWPGIASAFISDQNAGTYASATTSLYTTFGDSIFTCSTTGSGFLSGAGTVRGSALVLVNFLVYRSEEYSIGSAWLAGTYSSGRCVPFIANMTAPSLELLVLAYEPGTRTLHGRLSPGQYILYIENKYGPESAYGSAIDFNTQILFADVPDPLIDSHPVDQRVPLGSTTHFNASASGSSPNTQATSALTYRWRRNYVDLFDGGRISGAATNHLVIANTQVADSGVYDVVVKQDTITEPSSLARLTIVSATDVDPQPVVPTLAMDVPSPSPFSSRTTIRCSLPREGTVQLDVLDVSGRLVKQLAPPQHRSAGAHSFEWNGDTERGGSAPAGVYFVRLRLGGDQVTRRVVRLGNTL